MSREDKRPWCARVRDVQIGDFSKLSQVSVKTLRYYDEIGLLKPIEIDRFTGYRYYWPANSRASIASCC